MSGRDFVGLMSLFTHESSTYLITTSVLHPQAPESKSSQVRGHVHLAAWILTPTSSNCVHVTYIVHADPRGTIPARLVKFISTQTPLCVAGVRDYIEKYGVPMRFHVPVPPQEMLYCSLMREKSGRLAYECEFKLFIDSEAVSSFLIETEAAKKTKKRKQRLLLFQLNVDTRKMFYHGLDIQIFSSQTSDIVGNDESSLLQVLLSSDEQMVRFYLNADSNQKQLPVRSLIKLKACGGKIGSAKKCMVNGVEIEFDKLNSHFSTSNYTSSSSVLDDLDEAIDVINNDLLPKQKPSFTSLDGEKVEYKNLGGLETNAFVMEPESILASNQHSVNDNSNTNTPNNINNNNINNDDTLASSAKMKINTTKKYSPKIPKVFKSPVKGSFSPSALFSSLSRHAVRDVKLSSIVRRSIGGSVGGGASNNNSSQSPTSSSSSSPFNPSNACSMLIAASAVFGGSFGLHFSAFSYTFVGTLLLSRFFSTQIFPALDQLDRHDIVQAVVWWNISTFLFYVLTPSSSQHLVDLVLTTFVVTATVSLAVLERSRLSCVLKTNQLSPVHGFYALTWFFISSLAIWSGWVFSDSAFFLLLVVVSFYVCEIVDITNLISFLASSYRDHHHPNHHHHHHQISLADLMAAVGWSLVVTLCTSLVVGGKAIDATAAAFIAGGIVSFTHKTISSSGGNSLRLSISHFSDSMVNIGRIWLSSTHLNKVIVVSWFAAVSAMILAPVVCIKSFVYTCVILCNLSLFLFSLFTSPICGKIAGLTLVAAAGFQSAPMVLNLARHASKNHLAAAVIWFMVITLLLGTISGGVGRDMDVCSAVFILVCGILVASRQLNSFAVHIQSNDLALVAVCSVVTSGGLIVLSIM